MARPDDFFAFFHRHQVVHFLVGKRRESFRIKPALHSHLIRGIDEPDQVDRDLALRAGQRLSGDDIADHINLIFDGKLIVKLLDPEREIIVHANDFLIGNKHGIERRNLP